ncbi:MAG: fibronectin type III domain-containing protein [Bacteroidales bacterium]|nr:fibronectin type III domain-containing protein [Bacteroidales bacterium]
MALLLAPTAGWATVDSVTVANGTTTNEWLPIYGYYQERAQHNQVIYPADSLTALLGQGLTGMTFYMSQTAGSNWGTTVTISLGTTTATTLSGLTTASDLTQVWQGPVTGQTAIIHIDFDEGFSYTGDNLLLDVQTTAGNYSRAYFYGVNLSGAGYVQYGSSTSAQGFVPKTTFTYSDNPICSRPTNVAVSGITNSGATVSWNAGGSETQWVLLLNGEEIASSPLSDSSYTFTTLDANTGYTVAVRALCSWGDTSGAVSTSFRTLCQNGNCQLQVNGTSTYYGGAEVWQNGSLVTTLLSSSTYSNQDNTVDICNGDSLVILYHAGSSTSGSITVIDVAGTVLANVAKNTLSNGDTILAVANGCPSCIPVNNLTLNTFDANSATISWTAGNDEAEWAVYVNGEEASGSPASTNSFIVTGLDANTSYTVAVRSVCGYDDTAAARTLSFRTECEGYAELPFSSGFEDLQTGDMPDCWLQVQTGTNTGLNPHPVFPSAYRHTPNAHNSDVYFEFESNQGETEILALPRMQNIQDLQLSFYASITSANFMFEAGVIETDEDGVDIFVPVDTVNLIPGSSFSSAYRVYNVLFNTYEGDGERIAIRTTPNSSSTYTLMIDDFSVIYVGVPVLGPFNPSSRTYTIGVDTTFGFRANLMTGSDVTYQWTSTLSSVGGVTLVGDNTDTVNVSYTNVGIDTLSVIVSTDYGADTESVIIYVVDPNPISEFPYFNGFEDGEDISWNTANNASGWYIGQAVTATGDRSLYVSSTHGATNDYSNQADANSHAYRQFRFSETGEYELSFSWRGDGGSDAYMRAYLVPGAYQPTAGSSPSGTNLTGSLYDSLSWNTFSTVMEIADTGLYTLDFYWHNGYLATNENPGAAVDNISISKLTCSSVANLQARNVHAHEADIVWTPRSGETEWWVVVDNEPGYVVSTDSIHLSGYDGETSHTVSVRAVCAPGDTSFASTVSFTTTVACVPVTDIVFSDITGSSATVSWTPAGTDTAWKVVFNGDTADVATDPTYSLTGLTPMTSYTVTVLADCGSEDGVSVATSGTFHTLCDDGTCNLTLDLVDSYGDGWNNGALRVIQNGVEVGSGTIPSGSNSATILVPACSSMPVSVVFVAGGYPEEMGATIYSGSGAEIYSFATGTMNSSNNGDTLVTASAPCSGCPMADSLQATAITDNSITFSWSNNDTVAGFLISFNNGPWQLVNTNTYTATGLGANTVYPFEVRTYCGAEDTSSARTISVRTDCGMTNAPWSEDFESFSTTSSATELPCWVVLRGNSGYTNVASTAHASSRSLRFAGYAVPPTIAVLPTFSQNISSLSLSMWIEAEGSSSGSLAVGYITDVTDSTTFTALQTYPNASYQDNFQQVTVDFASAPAGARMAVAQVGTSSNWYWWIDDIEVFFSDSTVTPVSYYTVSATSANATMGSASVTPSGSVEEGTSVTATATPNDGYLFTNWTMAGDVVSSDNPYTFTVTDDIALVANFEAIPEEPCDVPTNVTASNIGLTSAVIGWTAPEGQDLWEIRIIGAGDTLVVQATTNPYTVASLAPAVAYTVAVRSVCGVNNYSDWSAPATFTTATCQPVTGVMVSNRTTNSVQVSWTAPAGVSNFELEYGASGFASGTGTRVETSTNSATLTGLTAGMAYDVYVRSVCGNGAYSPWSNATPFTTEDDQQGIDDVNNASIALFPNPATTTVTLTGIDGQATVTIVDMNGRVNGEWKVESGNLTIDLAGYAQGAYFVRITGEQLNAIRKLIVK